jgi:hypothetical protein
MTSTSPSTGAPVGVPAWLTRLAAAVVGLVIPALAWIDPGNKLPSHAAIRWLVILIFAVIGAAIFIVHLFHSDIHEYGWSMAAVQHVESDAEAAFKTDWPDMKATFEAAKPALEQLPAYQTLTQDVTDLKNRVDSSGLTPDALVAAFETATGQPWPFPKAAVAAPDVAATAGQAS